MSFQIGDQVGDYRIVGAVGAGGAGQVFKVEHNITGRIEAMKVLLQGRAASQSPAERFQREIKLQASLNHPNIASVHNAFWVRDELVMVMELIDGASLDHIIAEGPLPPGKTLRYALQCLTALEYAHNRGITHRDIKPENIMITADGVVKLMDFGLAKDRTDPKLTQTGAVVGSLYYISPEQAQGLGETDHRSDIYSFGAVLYEMVTGVKPFPYNNSYALLQAAVNEDPRPPIELSPDIPMSLNNAILQAMEKPPEARFESAREFRRMMEAIGRNPAIEVAAPPPKAKTSRRRSTLEKQSRRQLIFRACFVLLCLAGLVYLGLRALWRTPMAQEVLAYQREAEDLAPAKAAPTVRRTPIFEEALSIDAAGAARTVALSPASGVVAAGIGQGRLGLWDLRSGERRWAIDLDGTAAPAFSPDGELVAAAGPDRAAVVVEVESGETVRRLAHVAPVTAIAFSPDGKQAATSAADASIRVWNLEDGESLGFPGPAEGALALAFSPSGPLLAAAEPSLIRLLGLGPVESAEELSQSAVKATRLAFSINGLELAAAGGEAFQLWDMPARRSKLTRQCGATVADIAQTVDGLWLALTLNDNGKAQIFDVEAGRNIGGLSRSDLKAVRFDAGASRIAGVSSDGALTIWRATLIAP